MIWTIAIVSVGCFGLWLAPKHWAGWAICTASEILWFCYALTLGAVPLMVMSCIWFVLNARATLIVRQIQDG